MIRLLHIEFQKIWKNRASRILTIAYFILLSFVALLASINFKFIGIDFRLADMGLFNFPFIWHFNTYMASILKLFLAIVIVSMMANEYSYGTLKQNLIDGLSKKEFILSKFYTVVAFALASTVFMFVLNLILGLNFSSYNEADIIFKDTSYLVAYFLKLVGFFSFCLFLGILVKRSAFALGFLFVWNIVEAILKWNVFAKLNKSETFSQFLPLESMSNLIREPFTRLNIIKNIETTVGGEAISRDYSVQFIPCIIVSIWILIFIILSYKILQKRDL
ncbi:ABC transporter permease [Flavobacterium orientale]|uniref:ABC transporter permease n=1 Tax=Flavobacterium orientale TaxID=1756020 RepID=A0A916Y5B2_9FLAO|nr:ABC transporter permease [Flavobacterium orientale]GGD31396.1 ABC transporter permease [Flavobacterium orientale]